MVGLSELATYDQDGKKEKDPVFPYRVRISPTGDFSTGQDYLNDLNSIPAGSHLYNIYAEDKPCEIGGTEQYIGKIIVTSEIVSSLWGDTHLKFRHQRMNDDLALRPEWFPYAYSWSYTEETGELVTLGNGEIWPGTGGACPFSYLLDLLR